jgi:hypothetical protein
MQESGRHTVNLSLGSRAHRERVAFLMGRKVTEKNPDKSMIITSKSVKEWVKEKGPQSGCGYYKRILKFDHIEKKQEAVWTALDKLEWMTLQQIHLESTVNREMCSKILNAMLTAGMVRSSHIGIKHGNKKRWSKIEDEEKIFDTVSRECVRKPVFTHYQHFSIIR